MKKIVSLLSVALFTMSFATGCGKLNECAKATVKEDCVEAKFEDGKYKSLGCKWDKKGTDTKETCHAPVAAWAAHADAKVECEKAATTQAACSAFDAAANTKQKLSTDDESKKPGECKINAANDKCEWKKA